MSLINNKSVLLLNADYQYLNIISLKKALTLYFKSRISVLKYYDDIDTRLHPKIEGVPCVVILKNFKLVPYRKVQLNRKNVLERDDYTCQYCGITLSYKSATIDHVIPKSKRNSPGNSWENMVAACKECNHGKDDKTPEEAGLTLLRKPYRPKSESMFSKLRKVHQHWEEFLPNG